MWLLLRWGAEESCITRVKTARRAEMVLGLRELILPPGPRKASLIIREGRTRRSRCDACDDLNACGLHVMQRGSHIAGEQVNAATGVGEHICGESQLLCIQGRKLDAVVGGQAEDISFRYASLLEEEIQPRGLAVSVVEEAAVAVDSRVRTFLKDLPYAADIEIRCKGGPIGVLNAVNGPQCLWKAIQINHIPGHLAGMIRGEAAVVGRMPILRRHDQFEAPLNLIGERDHLVSIRHRKSALREKIILQIDEDEGLQGDALPLTHA